ncbi:hypothetical protein M422DRAFT_28724 [Sphaerobolus stellatus SS14]|nr:hypothetical protein M422DRAFT_28724 [Sphaerobolus stellatus SS14]
MCLPTSLNEEVLYNGPINKYRRIKHRAAERHRLFMHTTPLIWTFHLFYEFTTTCVCQRG